MDLYIQLEALKDGQMQILQMLLEKQKTASDPNRIYTIDDLSKMFRVTTRTIYNWKEQGILSFVQIGSKTYVTQKQLEEFLTNHQVKSIRMR